MTTKEMGVGFPPSREIERQIRFWFDFINADLKKLRGVRRLALIKELNDFIFLSDSATGFLVNMPDNFWIKHNRLPDGQDWSIEQLEFVQKQGRQYFVDGIHRNVTEPSFKIPLNPASLRLSIAAKRNLASFYSESLTDCFLFKILTIAITKEFHLLARICPTCGKFFIKKGKQKFDQRKCAVNASLKKWRRNEKLKEQSQQSNQRIKTKAQKNRSTEGVNNKRRDK